SGSATGRDPGRYSEGGESQPGEQQSRGGSDAAHGRPLRRKEGPVRNLLIAGAALAVCGLAQEPDAGFRGMGRLKRAPVSNGGLKVKLPRAVERQLSNGLRLVILESHRVPTVALSISIPSSHLRDPGGLPGVAEATAAMMMMGTTTKTARQI